MRLIDVDQVISDIKSHNNMEENNPTWRSKDVVTLLENTPEPPNNPLTLEELREMDGEPVWVVIAGMGRYAVIQHCGEWSTKFTDGMEPPNDRYGTYWLAYRRKLEEGTT